MTDNLDRRRFLETAGAVAAGAAVALTGAQSANAAEGPAPAAGKVKILAFCGSHRKGKTTAAALKIALDSAKTVSDDIETELIELVDYKLDPVQPGAPFKDDFEKLAAKISDPAVGGIILGSPVYYSNMSSMIKIFVEHWGPYKKSFALSNKVAGVLAVAGARNGGQENVVQSLMQSLLGMEMICVGDGRPSAHGGATLWNQKDDISQDESGVNTAKGLGRRVAEVALRIAGKGK
ncbi:MAG: flavodoxin family protein [Planctomycetota bacterium]|nr:flavodoxin family protein [Planctomycetota bacterium]